MELERLLAELGEAKTLESLYSLTSRRRPTLLPRVLQVDAQRTALIAEICNVLFLIGRLSASPELSPEWLRGRVRHFVNFQIYLQTACADLLATVTGNNPDKHG